MSDEPAPGSDRRGLVVAVVGCLAAVGVLLIALDQMWLRVEVPALPPRPASSETFIGREVRGDDLLPFAYFVAAAGLGLVFTRRIGRLVIAAALVGTGIFVVAAISFYLLDGGAGAADYLTRSHRDPTASLPPPDHELFTLPALLALLAGGIVVAVGIFTIVRSSRWPVMGSRYERRARSATAADRGVLQPVAERQARTPGPTSETAMWAAMERGEDPTSN